MALAGGLLGFGLVDVAFADSDEVRPLKSLLLVYYEEFEWVYHIFSSMDPLVLKLNETLYLRLDLCLPHVTPKREGAYYFAFLCFCSFLW